MNVHLRQFLSEPRLAPSAFPSIFLECQILGPPSRVAGPKVLRPESNHCIFTSLPGIRVSLLSTLYKLGSLGRGQYSREIVSITPA